MTRLEAAAQRHYALKGHSNQVEQAYLEGFALAVEWLNSKEADEVEEFHGTSLSNDAWAAWLENKAKEPQG